MEFRCTQPPKDLGTDGFFQNGILSDWLNNMDSRGWQFIGFAGLLYKDMAGFGFADPEREIDKIDPVWIFQRESKPRPKITREQAWYIAKVYPEPVTAEEATPDFNERVTDEPDVTWWESVANIINRLTGLNED